VLLDHRVTAHTHALWGVCFFFCFWVVLFTNALLGEGAGGLADCFTNAVFGGPDNFSTSGNIVHALVIINGICAATNAQLPDVQYRLVRILGRVVGLGWSQANVNVLTQLPAPTAG